MQLAQSVLIFNKKSHWGYQGDVIEMMPVCQPTSELTIEYKFKRLHVYNTETTLKIFYRNNAFCKQP